MVFLPALALGASNLSRQLARPTAWKKFHELRGGDKEGSRQRALMLFPAAHALLARRKDHGRSEAALVALTPVPSVTTPKATPITVITEAEHASA
jgi:hypothetical protein